jgi:predicted Rossmann fold nucleotide-binding protein DprA/Smf involved in DNA uptake
MRVIIAGTRTITDYHLVKQAVVRSGMEITEIVSGGAKGVDSQGERYAEEYGIPVKRFLPDWSRYGRAAGHRRNQAMAQYAEGLILVWDGKSRGSANMLKEARACKLNVFEVVTQ